MNDIYYSKWLGITCGKTKKYLAIKRCNMYFAISELLCGIGFWLNNFAFKEGYGTWYGYYMTYDIESKIFWFVFSLIVGFIVWLIPNTLMLWFLQWKNVYLIKLRGILLLSLFMLILCFLTVYIALFWFDLLFFGILDFNRGDGKLYISIIYKYCIIGVVSSIFSLLIFLPKKMK